jgi:alpha-1,2-mannosyltransferase
MKRPSGCANQGRWTQPRPMPSAGDPRAWGRKNRVATVSVLAIAFGLLVALQIVYFQRGLIPGDAFTYLGAGERLNAGHDLYALGPGDRQTDILGGVPLVSPPPIAVLFRPLAALGDLGAYIWWIAQLGALSVSLAMLLRRQPLLTGAAMIVLAVPLVYEIGVGNVNSFLLLGLIVSWRAFVARRDRRAGVITGLMAAVKLTPAIFAWWLITQRRPRAVAAFFAAALVVLLVSLAGAGLDVHIRYLSILTGGKLPFSPLSLAGMAAYAGVPAWIARFLPWIAVLVGIGAVLVLRARPGWAFAVAVITMVAGSPAVSINWYVLFLAILAPIAWPVQVATIAVSEAPLASPQRAPHAPAT